MSNAAAQGVKWVVMNSPTVIGKMQLEEFRTSVAVFENSKVFQHETFCIPSGRTVGQPGRVKIRAFYVFRFFVHPAQPGPNTSMVCQMLLCILSITWYQVLVAISSMMAFL